MIGASRFAMPALALAAGCSGGGGLVADAASDGGSHPVDGGEAALPPDGPPAGADVSGLWAQLWIHQAVATVAGIGATDQTLKIVLLIDQQQTGTSLLVKGRACDFTITSPDTRVTPIIPDAYKKGLIPFERPGTYTPNGDGTYHYSLPQFWEVRGAHLMDIVHDPLPTSADDPRVWDQDMDGEPGMTVRFSGFISGDIYIVERVWTAHEADVQSGDRIDGALSWGAEQKALGSMPPSLAQFPPKTAPNPDPSLSYFRTTRVPADADCAYVLDHADTLFR